MPSAGAPRGQGLRGSAPKGPQSPQRAGFKGLAPWCTYMILYEGSPQEPPEGRVEGQHPQRPSRSPQRVELRGNAPKGSPQEPPEGGVQGAGPLVHPYDIHVPTV